VLDTERLTVITEDEEGLEKTDHGDIAIVPLWKWLLKNGAQEG
jgi:predicted AAA+ superfamily ATPase